ncbi:MAG TPA: dihydrodipicolinate synthase family protein [Gemmataceae bacterium]|nr:dihydrodipicolinate synthase family protein [Gemmataceae bacterium]
MTRLTGLISAPHTPFLPDGSLNPDAIDRQAEHMVRSGVDGVFVCGTTGEGMSLTSAERRTVAERWVKAAADRFPVVVHVGHACVRDAQELAAHAEGAGANAIATVAPFYHKPAGVPELVQYLASLARSTPRMPLYYYDIPGMTGVSVPTADLMIRAAEEVSTFAGVKYSNPDLVTLQECLTVRDGSLDVLFGVDEMLLAAVVLGVRGGVGSTYNYATPLYKRMLDAYDAGDMQKARTLQRKSVELVRVIESHGGLASNKEMMRLVGVDCGPVRPPLTPIEPTVADSLSSQLDDIGFFSDPVFRPV